MSPIAPLDNPKVVLLSTGENVLEWKRRVYDILAQHGYARFDDLAPFLPRPSRPPSDAKSTLAPSELAAAQQNHIAWQEYDKATMKIYSIALECVDSAVLSRIPSELRDSYDGPKLIKHLLETYTNSSGFTLHTLLLPLTTSECPAHPLDPRDWFGAMREKQEKIAQAGASCEPPKVHLSDDAIVACLLNGIGLAYPGVASALTTSTTINGLKLTSAIVENAVVAEFDRKVTGERAAASANALASTTVSKSQNQPSKRSNF